MALGSFEAKAVDPPLIMYEGVLEDAVTTPDQGALDTADAAVELHPSIDAASLAETRAQADRLAQPGFLPLPPLFS